MSKKSVRVRKSFVKQWIAVISGSLFASQVQAAQAAHDRPTFREFRQDNAGIDRDAARKMFRQQFGRNNDAHHIVPVNTALRTTSTAGNANNHHIVRPDKLTRRIDRQGVINPSVQGTPGDLVSLKNGINLDLGSADRNITLGQNLFKGVGSVQINVGGEAKTVTAGSQVTASEYVAVKQVLAGVGQKLTLDAGGKSVGGEVDLGSITANNDVMRASDLVVPVNVTTYGDFARSSDFRLTGDLTNSGNLYAVSSSRGVHGGTIHADDITNTGVISSVLSDTTKALGGRNKTLDLGLDAKGSLTNLGSITASGNLNITAGGTITNSGRMESVKGNVSLDGPATGAMNVNNASGTIAALNGAINVRSSSYSDSFDTNVSGGDLLSNQLNLNAGNGTMNVDVNQLTGLVNQTGAAAHISASTADLNIGNVCLTGDPTFKNNAGNINISSNLVVGEALAVIASGNITSANNVLIKATNGADGANITLVAGAAQTAGGTNSTTVPPGTTSTTTITGASTSGGSVLLGSNVTIDASGTGNGGNVLVAAYGGLGFNSGRVDLGGTTVKTGGPGGNNGDFSIYAGAQGTTAITIGNYISSGGTFGGNLFAVTAQPTSNDGNPITFATDGTISSGNFITNSALLTPNANVAVKGSVNTGNATASADVVINAGGSIALQAGSQVSASVITLDADQNITGSSTASLSAILVNLVSQNGDVGTAATPIRFDASQLHLQADQGSAYASAAGNIDVFLNSSANNVFSLTAVGMIQNTGTIDADVVSLRSTGAGVILGSDVTGGTSATIRGLGSVVTGGVSEIIAPSVNLRSDTGNINVSGDADNLVVNAPLGSVAYGDLDSVNLAGGSSSASTQLVVNAINDVTVTSPVSSNFVSLDAGGQLHVNGVVSATTIIELISTASIQNANLTGATLVSPNIRLFCGGGSIGTSPANPLDIDANGLIIDAAGSAWIRDPNSINIGPIGLPAAPSTNVGGSLSVEANNNITTSYNVFASGPITLTAVNGSVQNNNSIRTPSNNVTISAHNSITSLGTIDDNSGNPITVLKLTSTAGSIGTPGSPITINSTGIIANAPLGSVNLSAPGNLGVIADSSAGTTFSLAVVGNLGMPAGKITAGGNILLTAGSTSLTRDITSTAGGITITTVGNLDNLNSTLSAARDINLTSTTGSVSESNPITSTGGNLTINAATTYDHNNGAVNVFGNIGITAGGSIFMSDDITATTGNITILTGGSFSYLGGDTISAGGHVSITSSTSSVGLFGAVTAGGDISTNASTTTDVFFPINAGGDVSIVSGSAITMTGIVNGDNILVNSINGGATISGNLTGVTSITLDLFNNIVDGTIGNSATRLSAPQVNLISAGDIGASSNFLDIDAVNLTANANNVFLQDPNSINLGGGTSSAFVNFRVRAVSNLTSTGDVTGGIADLVSSTGSINLGANVTGVTVAIGAALDVTNATGTLVTGDFITLQSISGSVGTSPSSRFHLDTTGASNGLLVGAGSSAFVDDPNSLTFDSSNTIIVAGTLDVKAVNSITGGVSYGINATDIILEVTNGAFALAGGPSSINAANSLTLKSFSPLLEGQFAAFSAPLVNLISTQGSINFTSHDFNRVTFNAFTTADITDPNAITIGPGASTANGAVHIIAPSGISTLGTITGQNLVSLSAIGAGSQVQLGALVSGATVSIASDGQINNATVSGGISSPSIVLQSNSSSIFVSSIDFTNLTVLGATAVSIADAAGSMNILSGLATNSFIASAPINLTSTGPVSATFSVNLSATAGGFDLDGAVSAAGITLTSHDSILNSSISGGLSNGASPVSNLILVSSAGNIGASGSGNALNFDAVNVGATASLGSVYLNDTDSFGPSSISVSAPSSALGAWELTGVNDVTTFPTPTGNISADTVFLHATGGSITVGGSISATTSIGLQSNGNIISANLLNSGLSSNQINLKSDAGNISVTNQDFVNVTANASGFVLLNDTTGSMNIGGGASSAGTSFTASAPTNVSNSGTINAASVSLTATNGGFTFNNVITGTTSISLTSHDDILNGVGLGQLVTPTLSATSTNGSIGTILDPLNIDVSNVTANAPLGSVYIDNASAIDIIGSNGALSFFSVSASPGTLEDIHVAGTINATDVSLVSIVGSDGFVTVSGTINASNSISIVSDDSIFNFDLTGTLNSPRINLTTTAGPIGVLGTPVVVNTNTVSIQSAGDAYVSDPNALIVDTSSAAGTLSVVAGTNLSTTGLISAVDVILTATAGTINIGNTVRGTNSISLTSSASILNANIAGSLESGSGIPVNLLNLRSTAGSIGALGNDLQIEAVNATANAPTGSVFLVDPNSLNFGPTGSAANAASGIFSVLAGNITSTGAISGNSVILISNAGFDLDGSVTGTTSIRLNAANSILNSSISGGLNSPLLDLTAGGDIGALASPLAVDTTTLRAVAPLGSVFVSDPNSIAIDPTSAAFNTFSIQATNNITLNAGSPFNVVKDVIFNAGGNLTLNNGIGATGDVQLLSGATLLQTAGTVAGINLTVNFVGTSTLTTNVSSITTLGGTTLTLNEASGIALKTQAVSNLNINASQVVSGNVNTLDDFSVGTLSVVNPNGNIVLSNLVTGTVSVTLNTSGGTGSIERFGGVITTPSLTVAAGSGGIGGNGNVLKVTNGASPMTLSANATGGGDLSIDYLGTGTLSLSASAGNHNYTVHAINGGSMTTTGNITGNGALDLLTPNLTHTNTINFDTISIHNSNGITVDGGAGGIFTSASGTTVAADDGNINLFGVQTYNGTGNTSFFNGDPENDFLIVNAGANVVGVNTVTVNSCNLVLAGTLVGNPLVLTCPDNGTIANSTGDVNLPSNIVYNGLNLAILASGNINTTGSTLIDLSSAVNGGSLTLMAGYDFTPGTGGQVQNGLTYTITGVSATGGSIILGTVNINLSGGTGNGGSLVAVANAGTPSTGTIALGTIDTTSGVNGGSVTVIGASSVSVGNIDTTGGTASGNVNLAMANPLIVGGPIKVQGGTLTQGSFAVGTPTTGNLVFNDITAPGADVRLTGVLGAADVINQASGGLVANRLFLVTGIGIATINNTDINELNSTGNGTISLVDSDGLTINAVSGANQQLLLTAGGTVSTTSAFSINTFDLQTTAGDIVLNAGVSGSLTVSLDSAGTITQTAGTIGGGGDLFVGFVTGPVTLNTDVGTLATTGGTSLTVNEANNLQLNAQSVNTLSVNVTNGAVTTGQNFTIDDLSISVTNGTINVSNNIAANNTAALFADDGMTTSGAGTVAGSVVNLSSNANIGTDAANRFQIDAATFSANAANVFLNNGSASPATVNASNATTTLDISTGGDLATGGNLSGASVLLSTGGAFNITNTINGTTSVSLTANGNLTNVGGTLNTPTLLLNSVTGSVGTSSASPFVVAASVQQIGGSADGIGGGFFVSSNATGGVNFVGITADGDISVKANGPLTMTQNVTSANGALSITAASDTLQIADNVVLTANDQIDITQTGAVKKKDFIVFGNGSQVLTTAKAVGLGDINVVLGPVQAPGNKVPTPKKNVTIVETGGTVAFGGKRATAAAAGNVFTAQGADILVSTTLAKQIRFEGNVIITADPPVPVGTPTVIRSAGAPSNDVHEGTSLSVSASVSNALGINGSELNAKNVSTVGNLNAPAMNLVSTSNAAGNSQTLYKGMGAFGTGSNAIGAMALDDDSYITTSAPQEVVLNAKVCTDLEFASGNIETVEHSQCVSLDNGSVLFVPATDTVVVTPKGKVKLAAHSVAMVVVDEHQLSVYDVNDLHKNSVVVEAGGRSIPLSPGKHAVVASHGVSQFADINPIEALPHRGLTKHEIGAGRTAYTSEFSVPSAVEIIKPLKAMIQSEHAHAKRVRDRVLKTSAIIMQITQGANPFELHTRPKTVALKW